MGTTSSFFGGSSGGDTNKNSIRLTGFNNITYKTSTQYTVSGTNRGQGPKIIPNTDTTFWLLEGNSSSKVYASFWTIDADTGACTNTYAAVQLSGCNEVFGAAGNGMSGTQARLLAGGGSNYDNLHYVRISGGSLTHSSLYSWSSTHQAGCAISCGGDGTLYGGLCATASSTLTLRVGAVTTDGTTYTSQIQTNGSSSNATTNHRAIGTEDGIVIVAPHHNTTRRVTSTRFGLEYYQNSALNQLYGRNLDTDLDSDWWTGGTNTNPFMIPTNGGVRAFMLDGSYKPITLNLSPSYYGAVFPQDLGPTTTSGTSGYSYDQGNPMGQFFGAGEHFSRQANGTYQHFIGGTSPSNYATFDGSMGYKLPFYTGRLVGGPTQAQSTNKPSSAIVGNFVLKSWFDATNTKVNIDTWNFNG